MKTKLLTDPKSISDRFEELCSKYHHLSMAVAFCGENQEQEEIPYSSLRWEFKSLNAIIGVDIPSNPTGLRTLYELGENESDYSLRIVDSKNIKLGIFHPKVYFFENEGEVALFIGSVNLTRPAFTQNVEAALLIEVNEEEDDLDQIDFINDFREWFNEISSDEFSIECNDEWLRDYEVKYKENKIKQQQRQQEKIARKLALSVFPRKKVEIHNILSRGDEIIIPELTLKIDIVNAHTMTVGFTEHVEDSPYYTSIFCSHDDGGKGRALVLDKDFHTTPKLITVSKKIEYKKHLSDMGKRIAENSTDARGNVIFPSYKYLAVLQKIYHIKSTKELWQEICDDSNLFDIWKWTGPYERCGHARRTVKKTKKRINVPIENPLILLLRVYELHDEFTEKDIERRGNMYAYINTPNYLDFKDSKSFSVKIRRPVISDTEYSSLQSELESVVEKHLRREPEICVVDESRVTKKND